MAGIVAYEASTATDTRVSSTISQRTGTQQDGAIDQNAKESLGWWSQKSFGRFFWGTTVTSIQCSAIFVCSIINYIVA
jgi:hypothetical protein